MKCLCLARASFLCKLVSNLIRASPLRRPCLLRHKATPPLVACVVGWVSLSGRHGLFGGLPLSAGLFARRWLIKQQQAETHFEMSRPTKKLAMSCSVACQGKPRALTTVDSAMFVSASLLVASGVVSSQLVWLATKGDHSQCDDLPQAQLEAALDELDLLEQVPAWSVLLFQFIAVPIDRRPATIIVRIKPPLSVVVVSSSARRMHLHNGRLVMASSSSPSTTSCNTTNKEAG